MLGNPEKRQIYDQYGFAGLRAGGGSGRFDPSFFSDSIFSDFSDILSDLFGFNSFFSGRRQGQRSHPGQDLMQEVQLTLAEAYQGVEKEIRAEREKNCDRCSGSGSEPGQKLETCRQCGGTGSVRRSQGFFSIASTCPLCRGSGRLITHPCSRCRGSGRVKEEKKLKVNIPAGADTGNRLRVVGEGEEGVQGGRPGDLYLEVHVQEDPVFKRQDDDLIYPLDISFAQAALGDDIKISTFNGTEKIHVPPETQSGQIIRLKGKGFKQVNRWGRGDLLILIQVKTPGRLTRREKELFKELRESEKAKENVQTESKNGMVN